MEPSGKKHVIYKPMSSGDAKTVKIFPDPSTGSKLKVKEQSQLISLNEKTAGLRGKKSGKIRYLIDRINYLNFQDETIIINFQHKNHDYKISKHVMPQPCQGETLECVWTDIDDLIPVFKNYRLTNLLIQDNNKVLQVKPRVVSATRTKIVLKLPSMYEEINKRRVKRYDSTGVQVQMVQNSNVYRGTLLDFSTMAFHVRLERKYSPTFKWINSNTKVNLIFKCNKDTVYSGEALIFKQSGTKIHRDIVLEPLNFQIQRFKPKEFRSTRQELVPSPDAIIRHPLTQKSIQLKILDMSGSGFAVDEFKEDAQLLPGLIIPDTILKFGNQFLLKCRGQIIYSQPDKKKDNTVKCGISILDMAINDHMDLLAMLGQAEDRNSYLCDKVDMNLLWEFFFRNGIIYSDNYEFFHKHKEQVKKTYENLYTRNPHIARHFIYQDKGMILGHMAMLRFYEKSWLLCLHTSPDTVPQLHQKLSLLKQSSRYVYESYTFASSNLDYLINYFDANDKFAKSVFSSITHNTRSQKGCSIDSLAYLRYKAKGSENQELPAGYTLSTAVHEELAILESFYENKSGGLMLQSLDLSPKSYGSINNLSNDYLTLGFRRKRYLLSLKLERWLKAVLMVNTSDIGLNMSEFTSCIKIFIIDRKELPAEALFTSLERICRNLKKAIMPIFIYPASAATELGISYEKTYNFWALDTQHTDQFFQQVKRLMEQQETVAASA
ncbi:MAG: PilZ domain-containing protein [Thermodesulfobacteriota bacterium]